MAILIIGQRPVLSVLFVAVVAVHPPIPKMNRPLPPLPVAKSPASVAAGFSPAVPVVPAGELSPVAMPGQRQLVSECDAIAAQLAQAPPRREVALQKERLCSFLDAALVGEDFDRVSTLGQQLQRLDEEASQLSLSEQDYLTLADRHAELVRKVGDRCKDHQANKRATLLIEMGTKLAALKALDLSCCLAGGRGRFCDNSRL